MALFALEIGSEELPARFLAAQEEELARRFPEALAAAKLPHGTVRVMSTPRRVAVLLEDLALKQEEREELFTGPSFKAAYDADGRPTTALEGFARGHGLTPADCFLLNVPEKKGDYAAVRKRVGGRGALELLEEICPAIISALPFAKRMRWGEGDFAYARPLRWILALLDGDVASFTVGAVQSGRRTFGHRAHGPGPFELAHASEYLSSTAGRGEVVLDATERRSRIRTQGDALAAGVGGAVLWRESLLDEVQGLCEQPVPLLGRLDKSFLELPREVLLTSMESHQKSFGVQDADGALLPCFLTVLNMRPPDEALVRNGWERILRARLDDARFFWKTDLAGDFDKWISALDKVVHLGPLGSMGDKARRLETLCGMLARKIAPSDALLAENAERAGKLCKADLVTGMVREFDSLQGVMGGIYARRMGEKEEVAVAIAEHYLPAGPESAPPETDLGALAALADKTDALAGHFGLGLVPTGATDPNGLRRCALGIGRILLERGYRLNIRELFAQAFDLYGDRPWKLGREECLARLVDFFGARLKNLFISQGRRTLLVEAALGADFSDVWAAGQRLEALERLSRREEFALSVQTFKRVANIIRKQAAEVELDGQWSEALLAEPAEKALADGLTTLLPRFDELWAKDDFDALFALLQELRPTVDAFFDAVMVMCEDAPLRVNRLNLLRALVSRLERLADFAALQI
ncbi:MAG: glycine--tRNA ligase subunit beta [Deltaproteobacteria bacterium]|jgi:glycyl-tRNA synthetase beta chain|nr:glycine--tRNA ligase subunit beta [Deltaproteobacteria bacterium]